MDAVRVLLEAGARVSAENNIGRTAAQLGAFVGKKKNNVKTNFINKICNLVQCRYSWFSCDVTKF